jgi:hypothetical protein
MVAVALRPDPVVGRPDPAASGGGGSDPWMGSAGLWMGSLGLFMDFFCFYWINCGGHGNRLGKGYDLP